MTRYAPRPHRGDRVNCILTSQIRVRTLMCRDANRNGVCEPNLVPGTNPEDVDMEGVKLR